MGRAIGGLTRERVLAAALELADAEGVERLSMRRLGERLGVEAMTLYYYVPNKQALLDGVIELVLGEGAADAAQAPDWGGALRAWAHDFRAAAHRHPRVVRLFATHALATPAWAAAVESILRALRDGGLPDDEAVHAYRLVATFATGYVLYELRQADQPELDHYLEQLDAHRFPATHALAGALRGVDRDAEFALGLDLLVEGLARRA
jgi:AcrR family transcriptional regulator